MSMVTLFKNDEHENVMFNDLSKGYMVQSNQHLIVHNGEAMLLDPGGHKIYPKLSSNIDKVISKNKLKYIFFSHQDPDIIASANAWLLISNAEAYLSELWLRFIPHFGVDKYVISRIHGIPDEGMTVNLGGLELKIIPAHFLHSAGNFQVYDPVAKILYSGDLGASFGVKESIIENFEQNSKFFETFHKRYLPCNKAIRLWINSIRQLDIEIIAPQHGAVIKSRQAVEKFLHWLKRLPCGVDLMYNLGSFKLT